MKKAIYITISLLFLLNLYFCQQYNAEHNKINCTDNDTDGFYIDGEPCGEVDCNDANAEIHPNASEVCDGIDNNCDAIIDEGFPQAITNGELTCASGVVGITCHTDFLDCDSDISNGCESKGAICPDGTACNDGNPCTKNDQFTSGKCSGNIQEGIACEDGNLCTENDVCDSSGICVSGSVKNCDDSLSCNGIETCDTSTGCVAGTPLCPGPDGDIDCVESCDETIDSCTANDPEGSVCDDGNTGTSDDTCSSGICSGI